MVAKYMKGRSWLEYKHGAEREEVPGDSATVVGCVRLVQAGRADKWHLHPGDFDQQKMRGLGAFRATAAQLAAASSGVGGS